MLVRVMCFVLSLFACLLVCLLACLFVCVFACVFAFFVRLLLSVAARCVSCVVSWLLFVPVCVWWLLLV